MNPWLEWGIPVIKWLQSLGEWLVVPMKFFTYLGDQEFYILIMPTILWCFDAVLGFRIGLLLLTSGSVNNILKAVFGFPRPYWVSKEIKAFGWRPTFGLPSGHAQNALAIWGGLAIWLRKRWLTVVCILLILLISISRIYLGVHFPTDTLGGWLVGAIVLALFIKLEKPVRQRLGALKPGIQIVIALLVSLTFIGIGVGVNHLAAQRLIPQAWSETASLAQPEGLVDPLALDDLITASGSLFGLAAGGVLLFHWGGFSARGSWGQRAQRYFAGMLGLLVIYVGLKLLFPTGHDVLAYSLRYLRFAALAFWAAYVAPRLFVRWGMA
jgi:membrane-associated phospholipid phosphatase